MFRGSFAPVTGGGCDEAAMNCGAVSGLGNLVEGGERRCRWGATTASPAGVLCAYSRESDTIFVRGSLFPGVRVIGVSFDFEKRVSFWCPFGSPPGPRGARVGPVGGC